MMDIITIITGSFFVLLAIGAVTVPLVQMIRLNRIEKQLNKKRAQEIKEKFQLSKETEDKLNEALEKEQEEVRAEFISELQSAQEQKEIDDPIKEKTMEDIVKKITEERKAKRLEEELRKEKEDIPELTEVEELEEEHDITHMDEALPYSVRKTNRRYIKRGSHNTKT